MSQHNISRRAFLSYTSMLSAILVQPQLLRAVLAGSLNNAQTSGLAKVLQEVIAASATSFIRKNGADADAVASMLRGANNSSATNICGPLAAAQLMGWNYTNQLVKCSPSQLAGGLAPADLWLADPVGENAVPELFEALFPSENFEHIVSHESIVSYDFTANPLQVGDFVYTRGGSYTHFFTVTRSDQQGRLYTVTNFPNEENVYIIDEIMLWDPALNDGMIRKLGSGLGPENAYTGVKGFDLWRLRSEGMPFDSQMTNDEKSLALRTDLTNQFIAAGLNWNIMVYDLQAQKIIFEWRSRLAFYPASTIIMPLAVAFLLSISERYADEIAENGISTVLQNNKFQDRSLRQLLEALVIKSETTALNSCAAFANSVGGLSNRFKKMGLVNTTYQPYWTTQQDLCRLWSEFYAGRMLPAYETNLLLHFLSAKSERENLRGHTVCKIAPQSDVWMIPETIDTSPATIQDAGIIRMPNNTGTTQQAFYCGFAVSQHNAINADEMITLQNQIEVALKKICRYRLSID